MNIQLQSSIVKAYNLLISNNPKMQIIALNSPISSLLFLNYLNAYETNKIEIGFHGTRSDVIKSIETYGMLDSNSPKYRVANGNVYGKGIYVSPSIRFASGYARNSGWLLVLLYIRGQIADTNPTCNCELNGDYTSPHKDIVVLRSTIQVLPIFAAKINAVDKVKCSANSFKDIEQLFENIKYDESLMNISNIIRETYDANVRAEVVYNLLIREMNGESLTEEHQAKVAKLISDFDYTYY